MNDGTVRGDEDEEDESSSEEDPLGEEAPEQRVYPEFLKNLPGV